MIALIFDIVGGILAAKYIHKIPFLLFIAALIGAFGAIVSNLLVIAVAPDSFSEKEIFLRIMVGIIIHPVVAVITALVMVSRRPKSPKP
jgi:uncharacterized membrane protein